MTKPTKNNSLPPPNPHKAMRPDRPLIKWSQSNSRSTRAQDVILKSALQQQYPVENDPFNVLVLNYTMMCNLACDFCCYGCNPKRSETMNQNLALDLIDQAVALGVFRQIGFTGGEPLIFFDEVLEIAQKAYLNGLTHSMISSCAWATDEIATHAKIDPLIEAGLAVLSISYDPSHGKWVKPDNVRFAANAMIKNGTNVVICASFYDANMKLEQIFPEYKDHPLVEFVNRVVLPIGNVRQKQLSQESYGINVNTDQFSCYKHIYHDLTVFWDGECYPCCSVYNRDTPGISLGNIYENTLAEIWDKLEGSLLFRTIKRRGFRKMYEIIQSYNEELSNNLPDPKLSLGPCELCHKIFSSSDSIAIHDIFETYEVDQIRALLTQLNKISSPETIEKVLISSFS